jgi:hypothetical protein
VKLELETNVGLTEIALIVYAFEVTVEMGALTGTAAKPATHLGAYAVLVGTPNGFVMIIATASIKRSVVMGSFNGNEGNSAKLGLGMNAVLTGSALTVSV